MKITALDIRKQEFARTFRGYDPDEVDSFLQVIATGWQEMVDDLRRSQEKIDEQQMKLEHYMKVEEALEEALQTARSSARQTIESAEKKAGALLEEAENRIVQLQKEADSNRLEIKRETARYAVRQQEIVAKLRAFLVSEMEMLRHFEADTSERTLQQPVGRREIEMYRDEHAGHDDSSDNEPSDNVTGTAWPQEHGDDGSDNGTNDIPGEEEAPVAGLAPDSGIGYDDEERVSEDAMHGDPAPGNHESVEEDWGGDDSTDEAGQLDTDEAYADDWEDEPYDDHDTTEGPEGGDTEHDRFEEDLSHDEDDLEKEGHLSEAHHPGGEDDQDGRSAPGWRVTPVFDSASDANDQATGSPDLDALPDDGADDEIRKIHEILKGLDEEQDADDD